MYRQILVDYFEEVCMNNKLKTNLLALGTIIIWGSTFPLSKVAMKHFSPYSLGFLRVFIAAVSLIIIGVIKGIRPPKKKDLLFIILAGACGFGFYLLCFNKGITTISSASSSIIIAMTPIMTAAQASYFYKERINKIGWISMVTAFIGVLIMMLWDGILSINIGMIWTFIAAFLFSVYNVLNRRFTKAGYKGLEIVTYSMTVAVFILSPFARRGIAEVASADTKNIILLVVLGAVSSAFSYYLWSRAISIAEKTTEVTNYSFFTPFLATLFDSFIVGDGLGLGTIAGGLVIIASIAVFNLKGKC